ncbi:tail fiber assembly protein [Pseudomonas sp. HOU2]|uniref:tail fiber assembly protein n=1 Tax=Pseudomonas sp. HOU2 TaxID=3230301 RepID=UPI00345A7E86
MNRYAYVRYDYAKPFKKIMQIVEAEEIPEYLSGGGWVDITANPAVQVGWKAETINYVDWVFSEPTYQEREKDVAQDALELLTAASKWLLVHPLQYKADLGVATPDDQALLLAYKQYCVELGDMSKQSGYPYTVNWPLAPF